MDDYLSEGGHPLLVVGPSKSGKTVLVRERIPRAVRIAGGELQTIDDLWSDVVDQFGVYSGETVERFVEEGEDNSDAHSVAAKLSGSGIEVSSSQGTRDTAGRRHVQSRRRSSRRVAKAELRRASLPIVVDDFERVCPALQRAIANGLRELIYDGVPAIFVATSSPGWDGAAAASVALGPSEQAIVAPWSTSELAQIAVRGLDALNVAYDAGLPPLLAAASRRSPCLMQYLCLNLCRANGVEATLSTPSFLRVGRDVYDWVDRQLEGVPRAEALLQGSS